MFGKNSLWKSENGTDSLRQTNFSKDSLTDSKLRQQFLRSMFCETNLILQQKTTILVEKER